MPVCEVLSLPVVRLQMATQNEVGIEIDECGKLATPITYGRIGLWEKEGERADSLCDEAVGVDCAVNCQQRCYRRWMSPLVLAQLAFQNGCVMKNIELRVVVSQSQVVQEVAGRYYLYTRDPIQVQRVEHALQLYAFVTEPWGRVKT